MKFKEDELMERALKVLETPLIDKKELKQAYRKKARQVHPDLTGKDSRLMGVVSQAYALLIGKERPTSLLENDELVSSIIGEKITPFKKIPTYEDLQKEQFYNNGIPSI